jgi:hypothetical protein
MVTSEVYILEEDMANDEGSIETFTQSAGSMGSRSFQLFTGTRATDNSAGPVHVLINV